MPPIQLPLTAAQRHNNQHLFSDHYLDSTLPQRPEWKLLIHDARRALNDISTIVSAYVPSDIEAQTEEDLIKPVLRALGHTFEVQASLRTPDGTKKPDYVFYRNAAELASNKNKTLDETLLHNKAFAVGDAKYWDRPLDTNLKTAKDAFFTNKNPSYQIAFYIQQSGVEWGILTNGRLWRLYHKESVHKQDRFYEVDLPALVASNDPEAFLYFYAFFHRSAFEAQPLGLNALLEESNNYARGVGESLRTQVYDALKHLAQGFLDYPANALQPDSDTLKQIYDNSLIVLYRLLFILYAEARELLPLRANVTYREEYSLDAIKRDAARRKLTGVAVLPTTAQRWARLKDLFQIIDAGSPPLQVATFNGGLFDPAKHPFLERYTVGDARLLEAIDMLARVDGEFVDYRDLAERHLGTIYEGLLEYHIQPIAPDGQWTIDLFNDQGERHRTGSYYTPDFVVQYIVEQTLRPLLDAAVAHQESDAEKIAAVLAINVLDPAMGSGHFPVAAMEYIARYLVDLGVTPDADTAGEADLVYWKRRVAQSCIYGVDLNPLAVDLAKLSLWIATTAKGKPLSFLDHHLRCGNALIGVQITTLDLRTAPKKKPSKKVRVNADQISMLDDPGFAQSMSLAVDSMWLIEGTVGNTIDEVREQERLYADLRTELTRAYQRLADVAAARDFGLAIDATLWRGLADFLARPGGFAMPSYTTVLETAQAQAQQHRFFHWDLEFPEVFFDKHGQPLGERAGFDAVIGNPPYVRQEQLAPIKPYLAQAFPSIYHGVADLSLYFLGQGVNLLKQGGRLSYITSGTFQKLAYGEPLRRFLTANVTINNLIGFGEEQVFSDAITYPIILEIARQKPVDAAQVLVGEITDPKNLSMLISKTQYPLPINGAPWIFVSSGLRHLLSGWNTSHTLREHLSHPIYRGVTTGLNDAFVLDRAAREKIIQADSTSIDLIKPYIRGEDLEVWHHKENDLSLLFARRGIRISDFLGAFNHLQGFRKRLEPKPKDLAATEAWPGRKSGDYRWYEIQDSVEYYQVFEKPRIHSTKISLYPTFSLIEETMYAGNTSYVLPLVSKEEGVFLLGILNSRVSEYYSRSVFAPKANGYYEVQPEALSRFPIPDVSRSEHEAISELVIRITDEAHARYELHRRSRNRILADLGTSGHKLNQKLTAWWELDFTAFRSEIQKVFKRDIPLKDRDDWEEWLQLRRAEHQQRTETIIRLETELNAHVYRLFDLTPAEIAIIESSTKYQYGEV
jgi:type I restriction-modification system DNA methylase subunit